MFLNKGEILTIVKIQIKWFLWNILLNFCLSLRNLLVSITLEMSSSLIKLPSSKLAFEIAVEAISDIHQSYVLTKDNRILLIWLGFDFYLEVECIGSWISTECKNFFRPQGYFQVLKFYVGAVSAEGKDVNNARIISCFSVYMFYKSVGDTLYITPINIFRMADPEEKQLTDWYSSTFSVMTALEIAFESNYVKKL